MEGVKRRRIAGDSLYGPQGPVNGTIIEEDMSMTESPSGEGAKPKETLESLGDRRKATLVNQDILFKGDQTSVANSL